jgi:hypothetical protein
MNFVGISISSEVNYQNRNQTSDINIEIEIKNPEIETSKFRRN